MLAMFRQAMSSTTPASPISNAPPRRRSRVGRGDVLVAEPRQRIDRQQLILVLGRIRALELPRQRVEPRRRRLRASCRA